MIKKKGIYIEKKSYGYHVFSLLYYDGTYLIIIPINGRLTPMVYHKYSGTTFINKKTLERTTITDVINTWCPKGVSWVCSSTEDFPIFDIESILKEVKDNVNNATTN